jgi:D-alanyl-D-alanine carboxypeptidase
VGKEAYPLLRGRNLQLKLRATPVETFSRYAAAIHEKLKTDSVFKYVTGDLSMDVQKVLSDKLPAASARDYHELMRKFNSRTYFPPEVHGYLDDVMEFLLRNPANAAWLAHAGMKGGSTAFTLSKAMYATDKKGNRTTLTYFMHGLNYLESTTLTAAMNDFELNLLTSEAFRKELKDVIPK